MSLHESAPRKPIVAYDTTLRDGQQGIAVNYSVKGKLRVARAIDTSLPVGIIEGGWPGANPTDTEFFQRAQEEPFHPKLAAFGMTRKAGVHVENDPVIAHLLDSQAPTITLVGKTDIHHVQRVFKIEPEENLRMIEDSVRYVKEQGRKVVYDAEHFFDGLDHNRAYAMETLYAAARGGAEAIALCDTNGGQLPPAIKKKVEYVMGDPKLHELYREANNIADPSERIALGIHTHADRKMAEANALAAVEAGVTQVQGTVGGEGERSGNADLLVTMDALSDMGLFELTPEQRQEYKQIAQTVFTASGTPMPPTLQLVGDHAFATKAGMHQDATIKWPDAYAFRHPEEYGNRTEIFINNQSGKRAVAEKAKQLGIDVPTEQIPSVLQEIKDKERDGYRFIKAPASTELILRRHSSDYNEPFSIEAGEADQQLVISYPDVEEQGTLMPIDNENVSKTKPDRLFYSLKESLSNRYPQLESINYEKCTSEKENGTTRVLVTATNGRKHWTTVGVGPTESDAMLEAVSDSLTFGFFHPHPTEED